MYNFVNPYNFVPFGIDFTKTTDKTEAYRGKEKQKKLLCGWLDVSMYIKTPLIIPDGAHPKYFDLQRTIYVQKKQDISGRNDRDKKRNLHLKYDFLKLYNPQTGRQEYAVSGSELRGLIRNAYEAVTNSCVPFLLNDKPMSQRVPLYGALNRRGLLGYDGKRWVLYNTTKELEEVIVIPLYEANGNYYIESLDKVRNNKANNKTDENGKLKYEIISHLNDIENALNKYKYQGRCVTQNAVFIKNSRKWDIIVSGQRMAEEVDKKIIRYLFVNSKGEVLEDKTGTYKEGRGWLQYNVPVDTSRVYHIAYLTKGDEEYRWPDSSAKDNENKAKRDDMIYAEAYKKLKSALYRDGASGGNTNNECNMALRNALESACEDKERLVPVYFFSVEDGDRGIVYMSGSAAGRIAQRRKWEEIMNGHTPCGNELCPACLLFGTIQEGGMKGHVRFTDAFLIEPDKAKTSTHTLRILAAPRTTAFEFYLKKPKENATFWNYDFYGVTEGDGEEGSHTNYYHLDNATPRGRKMYWHHKPANDDDKKRNLNNTMECLDEGAFSFKIYFDQISRKQLDDLIWTVELGDNNPDSNFQHKLGHAKPLGYGSVKLVVDGGKIRTFSSDNKGEEFSFRLEDIDEEGLNDITPSFDLDREPVKSFLIMANTKTVTDENVDYPRNTNNGPIYEWFSENRINAKSLMILPEPNAEVLHLGVKEGDIVEAEFEKYAEKKGENHKYGIFVKLPGGERALMHKKNAKKWNNKVCYEGKRFRVKITEIKRNRGKTEYGVTDKY